MFDGALFGRRFGQAGTARNDLRIAPVNYGRAEAFQASSTVCLEERTDLVYHVHFLSSTPWGFSAIGARDIFG